LKGVGHLAKNVDDEKCLKIIEILYQYRGGLGFNELRAKGQFAKDTLRRHLDDHLVPDFVEETKPTKQGTKETIKLNQKGCSLAFKNRSQSYGKLAAQKWAQEWLDKDWEPIDVTDIIMQAPKSDMIYLMRHREEKIAKLVVPPFLDASIYLRLEGGHELSLVPDIFSRVDVGLANAPALISKLNEFVKSKTVEAGLDPGPAYKRFLGTLKEYVGPVRYTGGPIPFSKQIQHQEVIERKYSSKEQQTAIFAEELLRDIENPPETGILFMPFWRNETLEAPGFWVMLNPRLRTLFSTMLQDRVKAEKFRDSFLLNLESFLTKSLQEAIV